jgi:hypothetical protein
MTITSASGGADNLSGSTAHSAVGASDKFAGAQASRATRPIYAIAIGNWMAIERQNFAANLTAFY